MSSRKSPKFISVVLFCAVILFGGVVLITIQRSTDNPGTGFDHLTEERHLDAGDLVVWSPDSTYLVSNGFDNLDASRSLLVWETSSWQVTVVPVGDERVSSIAWSPTGTYLAISHNAHVTIWDTSTWDKLKTLEVSSQRTPAITGLAWSPDGSLLAIGGDPGAIDIWRVVDERIVSSIEMTPMEEYEPFIPFALKLAWSAQGDYLASQSLMPGGTAVQLDVWDSNTGESVYSEISIGGMAWSPDGKLFAYVYGEGIRVIDIESIQEVALFELWNGRGSISWHPSGRYLTTYAVETNEIVFFDIDVEQTTHTIVYQYDNNPVLAWSLDAKYLATTATEGTIVIWGEGG